MSTHIKTWDPTKTRDKINLAACNCKPKWWITQLKNKKLASKAKNENGKFKPNNICISFPRHKYKWN